MSNLAMAELLFGSIKTTVAELEARYPRRKEGQVVTRFAPSPTGFLHIGGVYTALINERIAHQNRDGIFMLRIEDTDKKREVAGSKGIICSIFERIGLNVDEGVTSETTEKGNYGPYTQSERIEIYHVLAKELVKKGYAYPCFCSAEELNEIREQQIQEHKTPGYYREYAKYRNITVEEAKQLLAEGKSYALRFRVPDQIEERVGIQDAIKGYLEMENNMNDFVLLKEDGIPTYHFAHACDDHLMGTSVVIRADEWMPSIPIHLQLFQALGFEPIPYAHVAPIMKLDGESRRKLSKRKDPESSAEYYLEHGYPIEAIYVYMLTLINSNFEEWYLANPESSIFDFVVTLEHMSMSGALYDLDKLNHISSEILYKLSASDNLKALLAWSQEFDGALNERLNKNLGLAKKILETQGQDSLEHRKDLACYSQFLSLFGILYEDIFAKMDGGYRSLLSENLREEDREFVVSELVRYFEEKKHGSERTMKELGKELNYTDKKKYEKNPTEYRGIIFQLYKVIRLLITKEEHGISLDEIIRVLGYDEVIRRIRSHGH